MRPRQITTAHEPVVCEVCRRTLLRGEAPTPYLADGRRVVVCDLCEPRAIHEGWIREGLADDAAAVARRRERGSLLRRLRGESGRSRRPALGGVATNPVTPDPRPVGEERQVHGVPTNDDLKVERAITTFNASGLPQRMTGIVKSLGAPVVTVRPSATEGAIVAITIAWELAWYRFEVDLGDEGAGVRPVSRGNELAELDAGELDATNALDAAGRIVEAA
ncbi:MAG: hypothetical protein QM679_08800 [Patulibacter sp.]